jgi:SAM-dependent methyltransferase
VELLPLQPISRSLTEFPALNHLLPKIVESCTTFLDIGCGRGSPVSRHQRGYFVGVDRYRPYLVAITKRGTYSERILGDIRHLQFKPRSFDCISAFDVLEHLTKDEGYALLEEMVRLTRKRVLVLTPNGDNPKTHLEDGNPLQAHRSSWLAKEMKRLGFRVFGINGLKQLRGEMASIRLKPAWLWYRISGMTQKVTYFLPNHAYHLLCVMNVN